MPGLLDTPEVARLRSTDASSFEPLFLELMTWHHKGAVAMADAQLRHGNDPRLRIMADAIRHGQQGEIALMHGVSGGGAVRVFLRGANLVRRSEMTAGQRHMECKPYGQDP